jgi:hypothetical protein
MFIITKSHNDIRIKRVHTNIAILWTFSIGLIYNYIDKAFEYLFESISNVSGRKLLKNFIRILAITHTHQNFLLG